MRGMTFVEARKIVSNLQGGQPLPFLLAMSGTSDPLEIFVRAAAAKRGRIAEIRTLAFNTLAQALLAEPRTGEHEVFLLLPWDFVPEANWRSGIPAYLPPMDEIRRAAQRTADLLVSRDASRLLYVPAPLPPLSSDPAENAALASWLVGLAMSLKARILAPEAFSLGVHLATGCPIGGAWLGQVAEVVADLVLPQPPESRKVLVTDLDNVLWNGVIAEEGLDGIGFDAEGSGYHHFIYQSLLAKLMREGVIIGAVTRNDAQVALEPLRSGRMLLRESDFVAVVASYYAKSSQIQQLAGQLNLGLDSFVFVDDNPVELAEVAAQLPMVRCLAFPETSESVPPFCDELARLFGKRVVTAEDAARTELYRRRVASLPPSEASGADLTAFLRHLDMKLTVRDHSAGDWARAAQLINKTTQFNLNGRKVTDEEVARVLALGGRLYSASLEDRNGFHGDVLACLVSAEGLVTSFALSCRVFQRRVEYAFWVWLAGQPDPPRQLDFAATPRNGPFQQFLATSGLGRPGDGPIPLDAARFAAAHAADLSLFVVSAPADISRCA